MMCRNGHVKLLQVGSKVQDLRVLARVLNKIIQTCEAGQPTEGCPILMSLEKETNADTKERIKGC